MLTEYRVPDGFNIFDAMTVKGLPLENTMAVLMASGVDSIDIDPTEILYEPVPVNVAIVKPKKQPASDILTIRANDGQSLFDLALMTTGIDNFYKMVIENGIGNANALPQSGDSVTFRKSEIADVSFYNKILTNGTVFNTGESANLGILLQENSYFIKLETDGYLLWQ